MPRDLADVLHYFLPETEGAPAEPRSDEAAPAAASPLRTEARPTQPAPDLGPPPLPLLGIPLEDRDVVRAALAWNLGVETARLGAASTLVVPEADRSGVLWPQDAPGPLGSELLFAPAKDVPSLIEAAEEVARVRGADARRGGLVAVRLPVAELLETSALPDALRWLLLLSSTDADDLRETADRAARLFDRHPTLEIGVSLHGARSIEEARAAFETLTRATQDRVGRSLISYGLLVDDLDVYRAIAAQRPIGLIHPQAPASRALADVARLLYEDARSRVLG